MRTVGMGPADVVWLGRGWGPDASLKILTGVLVHRVTRPLRGSVSCGSGQLGMRSRVSFLADLLASSWYRKFLLLSSADPKV